MKTYLRILAGLVCLGVIVLLAIIFVPPQLTKPTEPLSADWKPAPGQGEYAMRIGRLCRLPHSRGRQALCRWPRH